MIKLRLQTLTEVTGSVCESPNQNPDLPIYPYPDSEPPFNADFYVIPSTVQPHLYSLLLFQTWCFISDYSLLHFSSLTSPNSSTLTGFSFIAFF